MKSRKTPTNGQQDLFKSRLDNLIDHQHELVITANKIDWDSFDRRFGGTFCETNGRPALATRLMVGLQYLKYLYNESDENVVRRYLENPYWQYFCGNEFFEHKLPCHPTSLIKWRQRIGSGGAEQMLKETVEMAKREKFLSTEAASEVYIDTTVQPKAITYPTDGALTNTARRMLVRLAENEGLGLKQTYRHIGKKILFSHIRAKHSKDWVTARKKLRKLRTFLGRVIRDIERKSKTLSDQMRRGIGSLDSKKRGYMPGA